MLISSALQLLTQALFVTTDVLFLQWRRLTRMRAPLLKGVLYLGLYYTGAIIVTVVASVQAEGSATTLSGLLLPAAAFDGRIAGFHVPMNALAGWARQCGAIATLIAIILRRVQGPASVPATAIPAVAGD